MAECEVKFDGLLSKETVNKLVIELLKHILYYQGQFPLPFEQVKNLLYRSNDKVRDRETGKEKAVADFSEGRNSFVREFVIDGATSCEDMFQRKFPLPYEQVQNLYDSNDKVRDRDTDKEKAIAAFSGNRYSFISVIDDATLCDDTFQRKYLPPFEQVKNELCFSNDKVRDQNTGEENTVADNSESRNIFMSKTVDSSTPCEDKFQKKDPPILNRCSNLNLINQMSRSFYQNKSQKKLAQSVASFELLFEHVYKLLQYVSVSEVVLHLGQTVMSPKETFLIKLPRNCKRTDCSKNSLPYRYCMLQLFRALTKNQQLFGECSISCLMPIVIMMHVPCDTTLTQYMEIKRFYKVPNRGKMTFFCFSSAVCGHLYNDTKLSKIGNSVGNFNNGQSSSLSVSMDELVLNECSVSCETKENMWVLLKPVVKGFKDYFTPKTEENIWM